MHEARALVLIFSLLISIGPVQALELRRIGAGTPFQGSSEAICREGGAECAIFNVIKNPQSFPDERIFDTRFEKYSSYFDEESGETQNYLAFHGGTNGAMKYGQDIARDLGVDFEASAYGGSEEGVFINPYTAMQTSSLRFEIVGEAGELGNPALLFIESSIHAVHENSGFSRIGFSVIGTDPSSGARTTLSAMPTTTLSASSFANQSGKEVEVRIGDVIEINLSVHAEYSRTGFRADREFASISGLLYLEARPVAAPEDKEPREKGEQSLQCSRSDPDTNANIGDPVDTATGAYLEKVNLIDIVGAIPLAFELRYASFNTRASSTGFGWRHGFSALLVDNADGTVDVAWPSGRNSRFVADVSGEYVALTGQEHDALERHPDATFSLSDRRQMTYEFDAAGHLVEIADRNGFSIALGYTGPQLTSITEVISGRTIALAYDNQGRIETVSAAGAGTVHLGYDTPGDLVSITDALGFVTRYAYDTEHRLISRRNALDVVDVFNNYDSQGRVISQHDGRASTTATLLDYGERSTAVTDRIGAVTSYQFDLHLNLIRRTDPIGAVKSNEYDGFGGLAAKTDALGNTSSYVNDEDGYRTQRTDALGNVTNFSYDEDHNLVERIDPLGNIDRFDYDDRRLPISETDALGNSTGYAYNATGLLASIAAPRGGLTQLSYDTNGQLASHTDASGRTTVFEYDAAGRLTRRTEPGGRSSTYIRDLRGRLLSETDPLGNVSSFGYDALDRLIARTDARGHTTRYAYDENGNLIRITDALGQVTTFAYDGEDRMTQATDPRGNSTTYAYYADGNLRSVTDALGHAQTFEYDAADRLVSSVDALGNIRRYSHDQAGRVVAVADPNEHATLREYDAASRQITATDPLARVTRYAYDALGRLTRTVDAAGGEATQSFDADGNRISYTDPNGNTTLMTHDPAGRLLSRQSHDGGIETFDYDERGLLRTATNARGQVATRSYDDAGRLITLADPAGTVSFSRDANGNALTVSDAAGTITRTWDALNRLSSFTDVHGNTIGYGYDATGNLAQLVYPDGKAVDYTWDAANRLIRVEDWAGRVTVYAYDAADRLTNVAHPNGTTSVRTWDAAGRLTSLTENDAGGQPLYRFDYTHDAAGNILSEQSYPFIPPAEETTSMSYGPDNRLATVNAEPVVLDADGNMIQGPLGGVQQAFTFDSRNRLIAVAGEQYEYDAQDRRVAVRRTQSAAAPVTVVNPGFEQIVLAEGQFTRHPDAYQFGNPVLLDEPIPGWTVAPISPALAAGIWHPPADVRDAPEGDNSAYAGSVPPGEFQGVTQELSELIAPGTRYELQVDGLLYFQPGPYRISLMSGDTVLAEDSSTFDTAGYKTASVSYTSPAAGAVIGQPLTIGIFASGNDLQFDNVRLTRRTAATETRFVVDPNAPLSRVLMETDAAGTPLAWYVYGLGLVGRQAADGAHHTYHYDLRGSTLVRTNAAGEVSKLYSYGPFGQIVGPDSLRSNRFMYNGRDGVMTDDSGLIYMRARFYEPGSGRFLSRDSILGTLVSPQGLNRFAFVEDNPISKTDPTGQIAVTAAVLSFAGAASVRNQNVVVATAGVGALATGVALGLSATAAGAAIVGTVAGATIVGVVVGAAAISLNDKEAREQLGQYLDYVKMRLERLQAISCRDLPPYAKELP